MSGCGSLAVLLSGSDGQANRKSYILSCHSYFREGAAQLFMLMRHAVLLMMAMMRMRMRSCHQEASSGMLIQTCLYISLKHCWVELESQWDN